MRSQPWHNPHENQPLSEIARIFARALLRLGERSALASKNLENSEQKRLGVSAKPEWFPKCFARQLEVVRRRKRLVLQR